MNSEFEPQPSSLPPEAPGKKKIEEVVFPAKSEEVDGDKWTRNQQPPIDTSLPEKSSNEKLDEEDIAEMGAVAAADIVVGDLNKQKPKETEMPDGIISEIQDNKPQGTDTIGEFSKLERRSFEESIERKKRGERGWVGTSFVDPNSLRPKPQVAAAPPPPPNEPPEDGPPSPYDKNEMPDGVYDKTSLKPKNEFPKEGTDSNIPPVSYDTNTNQTEVIEAVIDTDSSKYVNNFPPTAEKP